MKTIISALIILLGTSAISAKTVDLRNKRLQGLKLNYANTLMLEQTLRQNAEGDVNPDKIEVKFECVKKWPIRGRKDTLAYQCNPIEIEVP